MDFIAETAPESLAEATGLDTRYVAIVWRQLDETADESDDIGQTGRPQLMIGGMSEFEAEGMLGAAYRTLQRINEDRIDAPGIEDDEEEDDE